MTMHSLPRMGAVAAAAGLLGLAVAVGGTPPAAPKAKPAPERWWSPGEGRPMPASLDYANAQGSLRVLVEGGPMATKDHPFFAPLGANGRACVTCHQPADAMSLSAQTVRERWQATGGKDPLFAAIDGSNCPALPQEARASHSLLLDRGLFRIQLPWPVREWNGKPVTPDFTIEVVRDPNGCNSGPAHGPSAGNISVYRRVRPVANMKYLLAVGFPFDPKQGFALPRDPINGQMMSGNIMADNRTGTLALQMADAAHGHLQFAQKLTPAQYRQITDFEMRVFTAQQVDAHGNNLDTLGAKGGPEHLRAS
ncbi:MAG TPA: hypothetical protein VN222_04205, partial [Novosphingobium sp.]|nr:hypothetical protein [Novosphingobium sp.]